MTLSAFDDRNLRPRPDLGSYPPANRCQAPGCEETQGLEDHHMARRQTPQMRESWWLELSNGSIVAARCTLCRKHHADVTGDIGGHQARIVYITELQSFWWEVPLAAFPNGFVPWDCVAALDPQPPVALSEGGDASGEGPMAPPSESAVDSPLTTREAGDEKPTGDRDPVCDRCLGTGYNNGGRCPHCEGTGVFGGRLEPGKPCPTCDRRIPHPKKPSSPVTKPFAVRIPVDDHETFVGIVDAAAAHLGLTEKPHWRYWTLLYALYATLQAPGDTDKEAA